MQTDLTARLAELINAATDQPDRPHTAHGNHGFHAFCAICSGKAEGIAAALAPGVQALLAEQADEIQKAIETRRLGRRTRWLRHRRWPADAEKYWSIGMSDASFIAYRYGRP